MGGATSVNNAGDRIMAINVYTGFGAAHPADPSAPTILHHSTVKTLSSSRYSAVLHWNSLESWVAM